MGPADGVRWLIVALLYAGGAMLSSPALVCGSCMFVCAAPDEGICICLRSFLMFVDDARRSSDPVPTPAHAPHRLPCTVSGTRISLSPHCNASGGHVMRCAASACHHGTQPPVLAPFEWEPRHLLCAQVVQLCHNVRHPKAPAGVGYWVLHMVAVVRTAVAGQEFIS